MYPVYLYDDNFKFPPEDQNYFLVAGNGIWLHKDTGIVQAFVPVDNVSVLNDLDPNMTGICCNLPKIPLEYVWKIKTFFKKVVEVHRSEASTTLYFNKESKEFKIHVPKQLVSHGSVSYRHEPMASIDDKEKYLCVGTIHSHCDFSAFHSGTDISDEEDFDGLHCTFGHNNLDEFSISASFAVNGIRMQVDPLDVLEGIEKIPETNMFRLVSISSELECQWSLVIDEWMNQVSTRQGFTMFGRDNDRFRKGDKVVWAGEMNAGGIKDQCGDGPFEVDSAYDGQVVVKTTSGLAKFNEKLFKRAL